MKKTVSVLLCIAILFALTACSSGSETVFKEKNFSITLPSGFLKTANSDFDLYCTDGKTASVAVTEEKFADIANSEITEQSSAMDYANAITDKNNINAVPSLGNNASAKFEYDASGSDGNVYHYYNVCLKGKSSFFICRFACLKDDAAKLQPDFIEWAGKLVIE